MSKTFQFGNGEWAVGKETALAYNDENSNFKPLPFSFDRASTATVVNKQGLIETVGTDEPRIDFLNNSKGHLLLEPERRNLFTYSEDISAWSSSGTLTKTSNIDVSPNGSQTADGIQETTGVGFRYIYQQGSCSANSTHTGSIFVKKVSSETNFMGITLFYTGVTGKIAYGIINTVEGTIVSDGSTITPTFKVDDYGDYWRFSITATDTGSNTLIRFGVYATLSTNGTTLGAGTSSVRTIWGAQLEAGSYATSYIPTQGSAVTRIAETCNGAGNSTVFNDSEGVLYVETEQFADGDFESVYISLTNSSASGFTNSLVIQHRDSGQLRVYADGTSTPDIQFLENIDIAQNLKIAIQYKASDYKLFINGIKYNLYLTPTQPALTGLDTIDFNNDNNKDWLGKVKDLRVYNTALTDAELQALTSG